MNGKKKEISKFIKEEKGIKTIEKGKELLKGMLLDKIDEEYILKLKEDMHEYDGVTLKEIIAHVKKEYAPMDINVHEKVMEEFAEPPTCHCQ